VQELAKAAAETRVLPRRRATELLTKLRDRLAEVKREVTQGKE